MKLKPLPILLLATPVKTVLSSCFLIVDVSLMDISISFYKFRLNIRVGFSESDFPGQVIGGLSGSGFQFCVSKTGFRVGFHVCYPCSNSVFRVWVLGLSSGTGFWVSCPGWGSNSVFRVGFQFRVPRQVTGRLTGRISGRVPGP